MYIEASSIEDLISKSGRFETLMSQLDEFIHKTAPNLERGFYSTKTISGIGYGKMPEKYQTSWGFWPLISIAPQKNNASIYISARKGDLSLTEFYQDRLGKVSLGKGCIRVTKLENLNLDELKQLIYDAVAWYEEEEQTTFQKK